MHRRAWFLLILLATIGCTSSQGNSNSSIPAATSEVLNSTVPPTHTSALPSPVPTTESQIQLEIKQECVEFGSKPQGNARGILVFQPEYGSRLVFVDTETGNQKFVPDDPDLQIRRAYVSPNGEWLIYQLDSGQQGGETEFIVTKADGIQQTEIPFGDWGVSSIFWLNNNSLRITQPDNAVTYIDNFALDPFLGSKIPLRSDFPGIAGKGVDWGIDRNAIELGVSKGINIIYDPTLTKALYPRNDGSISLFNLETNQEIAKFSVPGRGRLPKWSPSGGEVAIIGTAVNSSKDEILDQFVIVSQDGSSIRRLSFPSSFSKKLHIENYSWSPDGSRIALWLNNDKNEVTTPQNPLELAVLDVKKNEVTTRCISGTSIIEYEWYTDIVNIIWSPDGTSLLIVRYNKDTEEILADLSNNIAYRVSENMQPIGWMNKGP